MVVIEYVIPSVSPFNHFALKVCPDFILSSLNSDMSSPVSSNSVIPSFLIIAVTYTIIIILNIFVVPLRNHLGRIFSVIFSPILRYLVGTPVPYVTSSVPFLVPIIHSWVRISIIILISLVILNSSLFHPFFLAKMVSAIPLTSGVPYSSHSLRLYAQTFFQSFLVCFKYTGLYHNSVFLRVRVFLQRCYCRVYRIYRFQSLFRFYILFSVSPLLNITRK